MAKKSISAQIVDEFIEGLEKDESIEQDRIDSLKKLLHSGEYRKDDIVKILKEEEKNENP